MRTASESRGLERRIDTGGWGALLVWAGLALLTGAGWGVGLVGAGVIVLAAQVARGAAGVAQDGFSWFVGAVLVLGGLWSIFQVSVDFVPVFCIIAGAALLASALRQGARRGAGGTGAGPAHPAT